MFISLGGGLSAGQIAGIAIGSVIGMMLLLVMVAVALFFFLSQKDNRPSNNTTTKYDAI